MIDIEETIFDERPKTRSDCEDAERPCPWVGCKYHLYLDVTEKGSLRLNYPNNEPWDLMDSCALDLAERDGMTLEEVGNVLCVSKERVRQLEHRGLRLLRRNVNSQEEMEELELRNAL
jgi:hypothetical protein